MYNNIKMTDRRNSTMVQLMIGHKGSGKTKHMIDLANDSVDKANGNIVFITKNQRLMYHYKQ